MPGVGHRSGPLERLPQPEWGPSALPVQVLRELCDDDQVDVIVYSLEDLGSGLRSAMACGCWWLSFWRSCRPGQRCSTAPIAMGRSGRDVVSATTPESPRPRLFPQPFHRFCRDGSRAGVPRCGTRQDSRTLLIWRALLPYALMPLAMACNGHPFPGTPQRPCRTG